MREQFLLDPEITYLNHGSFGACPRPIFEDYQKWQLELETEPVQFIVKNAWQYLKASKMALAAQIGCEADDFFLIPNPTQAINTIMRSLELQPGDEILATDHEYGAMNKTWHFYCKKSGAKYVPAPIALPITSKAQVIDAFWEGYSEKTRVIFLNHMSSATALVFPVKEIVEKAKALGLITIIDGAHIPGHIPLDIQSLDPDFYTGTMHKWMLTPKGSSFLYVKKTFQPMLDPLVVSWGYESDNAGNTFLDCHEQQGTRDISAFLTVPAAMEFLQKNNWDTVAATCRQMILQDYKRFCDLLGTVPICPVTPEFLGQMCSIPIRTNAPLALKNRLFDQYRIEIPVMTMGDQTFIRISLNGYNNRADLDKLYEVLAKIRAEGDLLG